MTYQVRRFLAEDADRFVEHLASNRSHLVQALARERLNMSEEDLRKPLVAAISGALSTAVGAFIPVIPFSFCLDFPQSWLPLSFAPRTLRCRRGQVSDHHPFLVEQWLGNDRRRCC